MKKLTGWMNLMRFYFNKFQRKDFAHIVPIDDTNCKRGQIEIALAEELLTEQLREQRIKNQILALQERILASKNIEEIKIKIVEDEIINTHPYCSIALNRNVLTIIWNDSSTLVLSNISIEDFDKLRNCITENEVLDVLHIKR